MKKQFLFSLLPLVLAACVSAPRTQPQVTPTEPRSEVRLESNALVHELVSTLQLITERPNAAGNIPVVDADAAMSMPMPEHRTVQSAIRLFANSMKPSIQESLLRSARYKEQIDAVLAEHGLPSGLAYLPVIESAYLPGLTSKAGARGIWQFMPDTAREYGLRVDWWVDERTDPEESTRAAALYLRDLYNQFGDWSLALAAYNCGPGRVSRTLAAEGVTTFWELLERAALPKETRGYVPTFYATLAIVSDPETYGFQLLDAEEHNVGRVAVHGPVSLEYIAEVIGADPESVKGMNPMFRRGIVPPGRSTVRVPKSKTAALEARAATLRYEDPIVAVSSFTLRSGDSVARLAKLLKRSKDEILAMNGLRSDRVSAGDSIYLPVRKTQLSDLLRNQHRPADSFYVVEAGDTLYSIAKRHGLTVEELTDLNQLGGTNINPGMKLRVRIGSALTAGGM